MIKLQSVLFFFSFLIVLISCSKEEDVNYKINDDENFKLTIENGDPCVDSSFEITKECVLLSDQELYDTYNDTIWKYNVLLPPEYNSEKKYPVLYLLHGKDANGKVWTTALKLKRTAEVYYTKGLNDIIIVFPDADNTYYMDDYQYPIKYETYFNKVLRPYIETTYSVSPQRRNHYIGGWSMGGYGAAYYSFKYCEDFSFCYAMSAKITGKEQEKIPSLFDLINDTKGNPYTPYIILDIGESDSFLQSNLDTHWLLTDLEIPHELILREGGHEIEFWQKGLYYLFDRLDKFMKKQ